VQTTSGPIRGEELTYEGTSYKAFKGIPYAAAPVGDLRFKVSYGHDESNTFVVIEWFLRWQRRKVYE